MKAVFSCGFEAGIVTLDVSNAIRYYCHVIVSWACGETARIWRGEVSRAFPINVQTVARRWLRMLHVARNVSDLFAPTGNRFEKLRGDRAGQYSIRVNDQYRVCFCWRDGDAHEVELVDYQ